MKERHVLCQALPISRRPLLRAIRPSSLAPIGAATLLMVAGVLKAHEIAVNPALGILYGSLWLQIGLLEYELVLAAWLLSGEFAKACRRVALATFSAFAVYSLFLAVSGSASCGCFGQVQVNPWLTFVLDSTVALLLWQWQPVVSVATGTGAGRDFSLGTCFALVPMFGALLVPAIVVVKPDTSNFAAGGFASGDSFIILEPEKWVGKELPIANQIDVGKQIVEGTWLLVLYHHDCQKCQELLPAYERLFRDGPDSPRVALIEVPPYGRATRSRGSCTQGRLADDKSWFVETPSEIALKDGIVVAARPSPANPPFSLSAVIPLASSSQ